MSLPLAPAEIVEPRRRPLRVELALVVLVSMLTFVPGIWSYSLVDPWETHYGEVARTMLQDDDLVHTKWVGTSSGSPGDNEGFRSKPVLAFWLMAAGMQAVGVGDGGGYSGEMVASGRTMIGIRLPFILCAIAGLTLMWWMLARLVNRRLAWLALLVVGSTPMFCMIARNAIPDMPMVSCTIGAIALFAMAVEDGARPIAPLGYFWRRRIAYDARHVVLGIAVGFVLLQATYYAYYFLRYPQLAIRSPMPTPAIWLPALMLLLVGGLSRDGWLIVRLPFVLVGGIIAAIRDVPMPHRRPGQSMWRHVFDDILGPWERYSLDRYLIYALPLLGIVGLVLANLRAPIPFATNLLLVLVIATMSVIWTVTFLSRGWAGLALIAEHALRMGQLATMRQMYLLGAYFLLGVSILAKGPPGFTVVVGVVAFHVIMFWRWRAVWDGAFDIKRGLLLMTAVALPWHLGMYLKEGVRFVDEYFFTHILNRAATGVDSSPGTFAWLATGGGGYTAQIGHGMWLWAALLPAALAAAFLRASRATREGRIRFLVTLWAIVAMFVFCFVQTKFHHYILPVIPPFGLLVAFYIDDLFARRDRMHPVYAVIAIGIVLLICRDLMFEPDRWIEMFVFRYDRPWPSAEPWQVDPSDGILGLGIFAAVGVAFLATRFVRLGVALTGTAGIVIAIWALQVYMPIAGKHWGMREAVRTYYEQRNIYGHKQVFFGAGQCADELREHGDLDTWRFETFIPQTLQLGQPMTIKLQLNKATDERIMEQEVSADGTVTRIGDHDVTVKLFPGARAPIDQLLADCERRMTEYARALAAYRKVSKKDREKRKLRPPEVIRGRKPVRAVDADRLIAWQLYWRGENFWSGGEIWSWLPEMKTSLVATNNVEFNKYINDRTRAPLGRKYFLITEAGRISSVKSLLPTPRARETYEVLDTTSNKFSLAAFWL
ncbi:MAG: glycosyltransferase family 39 protein [Deltaproteobacteria bacterium]|nr:glycosyltransferase family 39 protein [Deltaproteobacteria bacterium]MDQ3301499.1 hypothetical protein [Myxococcota bacterium]